MKTLVLIMIYGLSSVCFADVARITQAGQRDDLSALLELAETASSGNLYEKAYVNYRLAVAYMSRRQKGPAKKAVNASLEALAEDTEAKSEANHLALWAAAGGLKISIAPMTAMRLGAQNDRVIEKAMELEPSNPTVWLVRGIGLYHTPKMFGGGRDKALDAFNRSITLFDSTELTDLQWGHADAYAWRSIIYRDKGDLEEARSDLATALQTAPDYVWPRELLNAINE